MIQSTDNPTSDAAPLLRRIRSFVRRQGRITDSQQKAIDELWPQFGLSLQAGMIDINRSFARNDCANEAPVIVEIGFGNGHSLAQMAQQAPGNNYIGIEVHKPGVGSLLIDVRDKALSNIRIYCDDAVEVFEKCMVDATLDGVQLFFPDPWHKKRHNKRRIVQHPFVDVLSKKLKPGGYFHMATDWENYAEQMMEVMTSRCDFVNQAGDQQYSPKPDYRPHTKFEGRGERLGHGVWDLIFIKMLEPTRA